MTRGYFVITDCSKITDVAIIWGGTRPENAGASILEALSKGSQDLDKAAADCISGYQSENSDNYDDFCNAVKSAGTQCLSKTVKVNGIEVDCIADYTYVYNRRQKRLTMFTDGKKLISIKDADFPVMKDVFEQWEFITTALSIDESSLTLKPISSTVDTLNALLDDGAGFNEIMQTAVASPKVYIDCLDRGNLGKTLYVHYLWRSYGQYVWLNAFHADVKSTYTAKNKYVLGIYYPNFSMFNPKEELSLRAATRYVADLLTPCLLDEKAFRELMDAENRVQSSIKNARGTMRQRAMTAEEEKKLWDTLAEDAVRIEDACSKLKIALENAGLYARFLEKEPAFSAYTKRIHAFLQEPYGKHLDVSRDPFKNAI